MLSVPSLLVPVPSKLMPVSSVPVKVPSVPVPLHSKYISGSFDNESSVYGKVDHGRTRRRLTTKDNNGQQWTTMDNNGLDNNGQQHVMAYQCQMSWHIKCQMSWHIKCQMSWHINVDLVRSQ